MTLGTVRYFDPDRGFGYITPDDGGSALAVHREEIVDSPVGGTLMLGWRVQYEPGSGPHGLAASEVAVVEIPLDEDEGLGRHDAPHADPGPFAEPAEAGLS